VRFTGGTDAKPLIEVLEVLRELNATGARNITNDAPTLFVPTRWQGYLNEAAANGDAAAYRHYWELCTLLTRVRPVLPTRPPKGHRSWDSG
jgi:hypothetical protein